MFKKILLIVLVVVVVVVVAAVFYADRNFAAVWASPQVSYETLVKPETRALVVVNPPLIQNLIVKVAEKKQVPAALVPPVLAYQAALVVDYDSVLSDMRLSAFINDKRLGPVIRDAINNIQLPPPLADWLKDPMQIQQRGVLVRSGSGRMDRALLENLKEQWKDATVGEPLKAEGGHAAEVVLDNRDGGAVGVIATLVDAFAPQMGASSVLTEGRIGVLKTMNSIRLKADVTPANELQVSLLIEGGADPSMLPIIQMGLEYGFSQLQGFGTAMGVTIQGKSEIKGNSVEGNYTIPGFDQILMRYV